MGSTEDIDAENARPKATAEPFPGYVRIKFIKKGLDCVNLYAGQKGLPNWAILARDTNSSYDDHRPLAQAGVPEQGNICASG